MISMMTQIAFSFLTDFIFSHIVKTILNFLFSLSDGFLTDFVFIPTWRDGKIRFEL